MAIRIIPAQGKRAAYLIEPAAVQQVVAEVNAIAVVVVIASAGERKVFLGPLYRLYGSGIGAEAFGMLYVEGGRI